MIGVPTVREVSGLALSSRNRRLDENQRAQAASIYKGLKILKSNILGGLGIKQSIQETKEFYNISGVFEVEYLDVVELDSLMPIQNDGQTSNLALCVAGYVGGVRLLDNICIFKN